MAKQDFALDATATHRITVHWTADTEPATILLNGSILGTLTTSEEKAIGKDFILPDTSPLHVQFFNGQPQAYRAGMPLAPVAPVVDVTVKQHKRSGCLTTWLIVNLIGIVGLTGMYLLATLGAMVSDTVHTSPLLFLLLAIVGIIGIVGISMLLAWKKIGFYILAGYAVIDVILALIIGPINGTTFSPLIATIVLYVWLNRSNVWDNLE